MQRVKRIIFRRPVDRTGCKVPVWSRGDGARRQACGRPLRRTYSSPASRLWQPGVGPTVEVLSLCRVVAGCGWRTLSADFEDTRCQPWGCRVVDRVRPTGCVLVAAQGSSPHLDFARIVFYLRALERT